MPSFLSAKGIGKTAVAEIKLRRPYKNIYDFFWNEDGKWKHGKNCNKKNVATLIKIGAFESLDCVGEGKLFSNYAHMYRTVVEDSKKWDLLKKKLKRDTFDTQIQKLHDLAAEVDDTDWTIEEKLEISQSILGEIDLDLLISKKNQEKLLKKGYVSINEFPEEQPAALVWFVLNGYEKKKTKSGKNYLLLTVSGISGKQERMFLWDWSPENDVQANRGYLGFVQFNDFGFSTTIRDIRVIE
jgi:DNA polymerase III alpha subunit